jgi:hypothetical protein
MNSPVNVAIVIFIIPSDGIDHLPGFLGRGGIIEVNQRSFVDLLLKDRKIGTDLINIKWYVAHVLE